MNQEEVYKLVCEIRDAYTKKYKAKKKNEYPFYKGICLYLMGTTKLSAYERDEVLNFLTEYGYFVPMSGYWFPIGQLRPRIELMNKAIANYESQNK